MCQPFNYLQEAQTKRGNIYNLYEEQELFKEVPREKLLYILQGVWKAVQFSLPSWVQTERPMLTAAQRQQRRQQQQPRSQPFHSHLSQNPVLSLSAQSWKPPLQLRLLSCVNDAPRFGFLSGNTAALILPLSSMGGSRSGIKQPVATRRAV